MKNNNVTEWLKCAGNRAVRTVAQALLASIGTAAAMSQVDWKLAISTACLAGIISLITSLAGMPEYNSNKDASKEPESINENEDVNEDEESDYPEDDSDEEVENDNTDEE